jgi:arylsulfatase A-like enzyme
VGLSVKDGRLSGRTTAPRPIVHLRRPRSDDRDVVHEVRVRMRASAGGNVSVALRPAEEVSLPEEAALAAAVPWPFNSPLVPGDEMRTYVLRSTASVPASARHVLIRPTDVPGATFDIESVDVVSRREHLEGIGPGVAWQGLSEVYRETLVARSPDVLRFDLTVPSRPRMRMAVGTLDDRPVTFQVSVQDRDRAGDALLAERTVTVPHRWESFDVDLGRFAGRDVVLALVLAAEEDGALGFWGAPVVQQAVAPEAPAGGPPQGVIFIWADTLRRDHLPFYGYPRPTAPALARLAAGGTVFEDCVSQASWTKASGPSMMTSLYPTSHTVQSFNDVLPSSATTLAEVFRKEGRATLGLSSIPFAGKFTNLHQGYEELHESGSFDAGSGAQRLKTARLAVDRLLPWLTEHRDLAFYALLHVADPHSPFRPAPPYDTLFADPRGREEHERQAAAVRAHIKSPNMRRFGMPTRDELRAAGFDPEAYVAYERDWYDGSIRAMDTEMARLIERLRELGLDRRTLIVFMSDHGEEFLEHGRTFHQQSAYGELANVPLFFWWPGRVPAGRRVADTVQSIDVMPTLLDLVGVAPPAGIQGASLAPFFNGQTPPGWPRPAVTEAAGRTTPGGEDPVAMVAVSLGDWKLVHHRKRLAPGPEFELFSRRRDPLDQTDVAPAHPEVVARMARELQAWQRWAESMRVKPDSELASSLKAEELERLRALGYVQ